MSAEIRRSKCAARVRRANIELLKAEMTERKKTHKIAFSLAYVKKKLYLCSGFEQPSLARRKIARTIK